LVLVGFLNDERGNIFLLCKYYVLDGYVKDKLMKLISNSENKKHGNVGFRSS
jgi:hypothetical protein